MRSALPVKIGYETRISIQNLFFRFITYFIAMRQSSEIGVLMLQRVKGPKRLEKIDSRKQLQANLEIDGTECKQALGSPGGTYYCGVWKEEISKTLCRYCPHYARETLEYILFRRE